MRSKFANPLFFNYSYFITKYCTFQPIGDKNNCPIPDSVHRYLCFQLFVHALIFCHLFCKPKEHFLCPSANVGKN